MKPLHLSLLALILAAPQAMALSSDQQQPVYINSDSQQVDMKSNRVFFKGNVSLKQGSISIDADEIIVTRDAESESIEQIQALGQPVTFSQLLDDGKTLAGEANRLDYNIKSDELKMAGQAKLSQEGNTITSSTIRYQIGAQKLVADGTQNERVTTVLQPSQVSNP